MQVVWQTLITTPILIGAIVVGVLVAMQMGRLSLGANRILCIVATGFWAWQFNSQMNIPRYQTVSLPNMLFMLTVYILTMCIALGGFGFGFIMPHATKLAAKNSPK